MRTVVLGAPLFIAAVSGPAGAVERLAGFAAPAKSAPAFEVWAGAFAESNAWSVYSGATYAPFGSVREDGWRLRVAASYGQYRSGVSPHNLFISSSTDALIGYQMGFGPLTLKAFAGAIADMHGEAGNLIGWKAVAEGWINITDAQWASVDLAYGSTHQSYSARVRLGQRLWPALSVGLEAGTHTTSDYEGRRAGAFVRYEWASGEASVAAGVTDDVAHPMAPYATLSWLTRF